MALARCIGALAILARCAEPLLTTRQQLRSYTHCADGAVYTIPALAKLK
jgi:hypothetical protein